MKPGTVLAVIALILMSSFVAADDSIAIAALRKAGATVERDNAAEESMAVKVTYLLRQVTAEGIQALKELEELSAIEFQGSGDTEISVATLRAIQGKRSLKHFAIANAKMSDDAAKILGGLTSLETLEFRSQVELSAAGQKQILKLKSIRDLTLSDRLATNDALSDLVALPQLKTLSLRSVFVTDQGLASLSQFPNLRTLRIFISSEVTEVGIRRLAELRLKDLEMTYADVTDAKLKELRKLNGLKSLRFVNPIGVTDEGISSLSELGDLKQLDLADAKLSSKGIAELKRSLPNCSIQYLPIKRD